MGRRRGCDSSLESALRVARLYSRASSGRDVALRSRRWVERVESTQEGVVNPDCCEVAVEEARDTWLDSRCPHRVVLHRFPRVRAAERDEDVTCKAAMVVRAQLPEGEQRVGDEEAGVAVLAITIWLRLVLERVDATADSHRAPIAHLECSESALWNARRKAKEETCLCCRRDLERSLPSLAVLTIRHRQTANLLPIDDMRIVAENPLPHRTVCTTPLARLGEREQEGAVRLENGLVGSLSLEVQLDRKRAFERAELSSSNSVASRSSGSDRRRRRWAVTDWRERVEGMLVGRRDLAVAAYRNRCQHQPRRE